MMVGNHHDPPWMSRWRLGSMVSKSIIDLNIHHLEVGYNPFTMMVGIIMTGPQTPGKFRK